ncbi:hypothetical protein GCM10027073_05330 [Streptomyces chlorus]
MQVWGRSRSSGGVQSRGGGAGAGAEARIEVVSGIEVGIGKRLLRRCVIAAPNRRTEDGGQAGLILNCVKVAVPACP